MTFKPLAEAVSKAKGDQKGVSEMCQIIEDSRQEGREEGREEAIVANIKAMMETLSLTVDQALAALKIPADNRSKYMEALREH